MTQIAFELASCIIISSISSTLHRISLPPNHVQVLGWISQVSVKPFFKHYKGSFKGESFDSNEPPMKVFKKNVPCKPLFHL